MLQVFGIIGVYGPQKILEKISTAAPIIDGHFKQLGLARKVPPIDSWCYGSPMYQFHSDELDEELGGFLAANTHLGDVLSIYRTEIEYAVITIFPLGQNDEYEFSCMLSHDTLKSLLHTGLNLEIAPARVLPDAPYWINTQQ